MTNIQLYSKISSLPADLRKEVSDFIEFLKLKSKPAKKIKASLKKEDREMIAGYKNSAKENKLLSKEFSSVDLENWDEY